MSPRIPLEPDPRAARRPWWRWDHLDLAVIGLVVGAVLAFAWWGPL